MVSKQAHAVKSGVGGIFDEARKVEFAEGQLGNEEAAAADIEGLLGGAAKAYCCCRLVKSALVVTVFPSVEIVTIPN